MLQSSGLDYRDDPVMQSLRRVGVASIMNRGFYHCSSRLTRNSVVHILDQTPEWILVDAKDAASMELLPGVDLARYIEEHSELDDTDEIDLLQIPARRYQLTSISILATLQEALDKLDKTGAEALYVERIGRFRSASIEGILTREQIESAYRF
jgi:hypothetical protein